jgi:hypothetical protein
MTKVQVSFILGDNAVVDDYSQATDAVPTRRSEVFSPRASKGEADASNQTYGLGKIPKQALRSSVNAREL